MHRSLALLPLALAAGCGSVTFDELDPFGRIASAEWLVLDRPDGERHLLVVSNVGKLCARLDDAAVEYTDAWDDWVDAVEEAGRDEARIAAATERFLDRAFTATKRLNAPGAAYLVLVPPDGAPPKAGDLTFQGPRAWTGRVRTFDDNPFRKAEREADPADVDEVLDRMARAWDEWSVASGTATLDPRGDDGWRLDLEGTLVEDDGDDAGTVQVRTTFRRCEIAVPGRFQLPF